MGSPGWSWLVCMHVRDCNSKDNDVHACAHHIAVEKKKEWWGKYKDKSRQAGREGENPLLFFQSGGVVLLTWWFILSPPLLHVPISTLFPSLSLHTHTRPPFLSFISACLLSVGSLWTELFRNDDRNAFGQTRLWEWLTCNAGRFSSRLILTVHLFFSEYTSEELSLPPTSHFFYSKSAIKWCMT